MLRLRKNLQITPPNGPNEKIKVTDPQSGKSFYLGRHEVQLLRLIAKLPIPEVANRLNVPEREVQNFIESLQREKLLEGPVSNNSVNFALQPIPTQALENTKELPAIELRPDLELFEDEDKLMIEDPRSGRFFSLGITETALLSELIERPIAQVAKQTGRTAAELENFSRELAAKGLLLRPTYPAEIQAPSRNLLSFLVGRFKLCNPDNFLSWLDHHAGWLWKSDFAFVHFAVILCGFYLWLSKGSSFAAYGFPKMTANFWLDGLIFLGIISVILTAHEIAHGLALKAFGGRVPEMGLFVLYGFPSAYTNVSGAYKLPQKSQKVWVLLAGVLLQAWVGSLAFIVWTFSVGHTWLSDLAYLVSFASFINLAINLNPLIKLDGYYLLTLLFNKPNLRGKSFEFMTTGRGARSLGEGLLFLSFGLASLIYTAVLLFFLFVSIYKLGLDKAPLLSALSLALLLIASKTHLPAATPISVPANISISQPSQGLAKSGQFTNHNLSTPRKKSNWPALVAFGVLLAALFLEVPHQIGGEGEITPRAEGRAVVRSPIQGVIQKVHVRSGDYVKAGDKLVEVLDWTLMEQLTQAAGGNALAGGGAPRLKELASQIEQAKISAQKSRIELEKAKLTYANNLRKAETFTNLAKEGAFSRNTAQEAVLNAQLAQQDIERLNKELQLNAEMQLAAQANLQTLNGQIGFYRQKSNLQTIKSPIAGYVLTEDIDLSKGALTSAQEALLSVAELKQVQVRVKVVQEDLPFVKLGQSVKAKIRAYPDQEFKGVVSAISLASEDPQKADPTLIKDISRKHWNVTMTIENPNLLLKPGMSGYAYIDSTERRKVWQLIGREVYRVFSLERFAVLRESLANAGF